jgi:hypothetical protein
MTPAEEARFIALWQAGTETAAIAQQLGIPVGTVSSRAYTLVRQGKLQPRPRGGAYPRQRGQGHGESPPAPHPRVNIKQWTVRLSHALIEAVKTEAAAEGKEPSHMVEELLWNALNDRHSSTP